MNTNTINQTALISQFQQLLQPEAPVRVMYLTGEAKTGKTHMLTRAFPALTDMMTRIQYAVIDLRHPLQSPLDILNRAAYLIGDKTTFAPYHSAYHEWLTRPPIEIYSLRSVFSLISAPSSHQTGQHIRMVRHLTDQFVMNLRHLTDQLILFFFDAVESADEHTQNWLINSLVSQLANLSHVRVVVAGRVLPHSSSADRSFWHTLTPVRDAQAYITYCDDIGCNLTEQFIRDTIASLHYIPGLFAEIAWCITRRTGDLIIHDLATITDNAAKAAAIAEVILQDLPETSALIARRCALLHWFDQQIIAALLPADAQSDAATIYEQLATLPYIETHSSLLAYHALTRQGLLEHYAVTQPDLLQTTAALAAPAYAERDEDRLTVEALFCHLVAGDTESATSMFDRLLARFIASDTWHYVAGMQRMQAEAEALPFVRPVQRTSNYWLVQGIAQQVVGNLHQAIINYDKALELDPSNIEAYVSRGSAYLSAALADFDRVHDLNPSAMFAYQESHGPPDEQRQVAADATGSPDSQELPASTFNQQMWKSQVIKQLTIFAHNPWQHVQLAGSSSVLTYLVMTVLKPLLEQFEHEPVVALQVLSTITSSSAVNYIVHHARRIRYQPARLFERNLQSMPEFRTAIEDILLALDSMTILQQLLTGEQVAWLRQKLPRECLEYGENEFVRLRQKLHESYRTPIYERIQLLHERQGHYTLEDLEILQEGLNDAAPRVRVTAARRIAHFTDTLPAQMVARLLEAALHDSDARARNAAALTLGNLGERIVSQHLIDELVLKLGDTDKFVRSSAAHVVEELGELAAHATIIQRLVLILLDDEDVYARESAACALGRLGVAAAIPEVMNALMKVSREDESITVHDATVSALMTLKKARKKQSVA